VGKGISQKGNEFGGNGGKCGRGEQR